MFVRVERRRKEEKKGKGEGRREEKERKGKETLQWKSEPPALVRVRGRRAPSAEKESGSARESKRESGAPAALSNTQGGVSERGSAPAGPPPTDPLEPSEEWATTGVVGVCGKRWGR